MRPALIAILAVLVLAPAARAQDADVVRSLRSDPVYVAPGAEPGLSPGERARVESAIAHDSGPGQLYVAVLPASDGPPRQAGQRLSAQLGTGVYAIVTGGSFI